MHRVWPPKIMGKEETYNYILDSNCSVARFGDGEVSLMAMIGIGFQKPSFALRKELAEVAKSNDPGFLVCIPIVINDKSELSETAEKWWKSNLRLMGIFWRKYFSSGHIFGDTEITRPWMDTQNQDLATMCFKKMFSLWRNKDIVLIEGRKSRLGVGNDFFKEAKSVRRILGPERDAYAKVDEIYEKAITMPKDSLFLIALGPTATVLAYRLHKAGYRAIDIGHADVEYEWYKMRADHKIPLKNKYVNEAGGAKALVEDETLDADYLSQIICVLE